MVKGQKQKRTRINPDVILQIQLAEEGMNARGLSKADKNKAIKLMTGIRSVDTIRLIRESGFDFDKYKESLPLRYPQSYARYNKGPSSNGIEEQATLALDPYLPASDCESQIYNYLAFYYKDNLRAQINVLASIIMSISHIEED